MTHETPRRAVLALLLGSAGAAALPRLAAAQDLPYLMGDVPIGSPDAPVTVYEYISLTCPHCASFHVHTWPQIKADYVDTGKARFIVREVYFDRFGLWAAMAARCGDEAAYHAMIDQFLARQQVWTRDEDVPEAIRRIARLNGVPEDRLAACMGDRAYAEALVAAFQEQSTADAIESTPTFVINGEKASGNMSPEAFGALIDKHL